MHLLQTRSLTSKLWFKQSKLVKINLLFAPRFSITSNQSVIWFFVRFLLLHNKMHWTEPTRVQISLDTKKTRNNWWWRIDYVKRFPSTFNHSWWYNSMQWSNEPSNPPIQFHTSYVHIFQMRTTQLVRVPPSLQS